VIDVADTPERDSKILSLLDAGETTVPACDHCRASKDSKRLKIWLKSLLDEEPTYFNLILNNHRQLENTVSLIVKRVNNETKNTAE
jgi:hypothetical protein